MKVFKFGGASVKDAAGVKNILRVLRKTGFEDTLIVVSAMGKTTNALEQMVHSFFENKEQFPKDLEKVRKDHYHIIEDLFEFESGATKQKVNTLFESIMTFLKATNSNDYSLVYDQVVSVGELVSTTIISDYMEREGIKNTWLDARECIKTDAYFRDANLCWTDTEESIKQAVRMEKAQLSHRDLLGVPPMDYPPL